MRPIAQLAVIATHALLFFAPLTSNFAVTVALSMTRFSRESFFFISAFVLTLAYGASRTFDRRRFWRRRLVTIGVPYLAWTIIYFVYITSHATKVFPFYSPDLHYLDSYAGLHALVTLVLTGYYQLYFIVVLIEFYVVFPALLSFLHRARRWHVHLLIVVVVWQILYDQMIRRHWLPFSIGGKLETRLILSYPIYLLGGMIAAIRYRDFHHWVTTRARVVLTALAASAALVITLDGFHTVHFVAHYLMPGSDVQSPVAILYDVSAILALYSLGVLLAGRRSTNPVRRVAASGADASFGIYLSQMIWIPMLERLARKLHVASHVAWPLVVVGVVAMTFAAGYVVTMLVRRTPLSRVLLGQTRVVGRPRWLARRLDGPTVRRRSSGDVGVDTPDAAVADGVPGHSFERRRRARGSQGPNRAAVGDDEEP